MIAIWTSESVSSVTQSWTTLCDPMDFSTPSLPVHHQLPEFTQTHVHWVGDAIQSLHPLSSPSPPTFNLSQHQDLFKWVSFLHQVATKKAEHKGTLLHCWWERKLVQPLWGTVWRFLKKTGNWTALWPSNPTAGHTHWGNQSWKRHVYLNVHCSTIYNSQDMEAT